MDWFYLLAYDRTDLVIVGNVDTVNPIKTQRKNKWERERLTRIKSLVKIHGEPLFQKWEGTA